MAALPVSGAATPAVLPFGTTLHHAGGSNSASCLLTAPASKPGPRTNTTCCGHERLAPKRFGLGQPPDLAESDCGWTPRHVRAYGPDYAAGQISEPLVGLAVDLRSPFAACTLLYP